MLKVIYGVIAADVAVLALSVVGAMQLKFGIGVWNPTGVDEVVGTPWVDFGWVVPMWLLGLGAADAYSRRNFARGADEFKSVMSGTAGAAAGISVVAYLINYDMSRGFYLLVFVVGSCGLLAERWLVRRLVIRLRRRNLLMHRLVAFGDEGDLKDLHRVLSRERGLGYDLVAAASPTGHELPGVALIKSGIEPLEACRRWEADTLLIGGGSGLRAPDLRRIGWDIEGQGIDLIVVPGLVDVAGPRIHTRPVSGLPFMHIEPPQLARVMRWRKVVFDRVMSLALLVVLTPLLLGVGLLIKLEDGGPVLFRHPRIGLRGQSFSVWKFRSMRRTASDEHGALLKRVGASPLLFKVPEDPRVTRIGGFIRCYSLDELPQLVNVLKGEMSLVGPRPQVAEEVAQYDPHHHRRLQVRPGMTGLWQVSGRSNLDWEESVRLDLYYIDNWSMAADLAIIARTIRAVLRADGAY